MDKLNIDVPHRKKDSSQQNTFGTKQNQASYVRVLVCCPDQSAIKQGGPVTQTINQVR